MEDVTSLSWGFFVYAEKLIAHLILSPLLILGLFLWKYLGFSLFLNGRIVDFYFRCTAKWFICTYIYTYTYIHTYEFFPSDSFPLWLVTLCPWCLTFTVMSLGTVSYCLFWVLNCDLIMFHSEIFSFFFFLKYFLDFLFTSPIFSFFSKTGRFFKISTSSLLFCFSYYLVNTGSFQIVWGT